ncbi:hypothetical protein [Rhodococcus sp. NPDC059234]|uniref:hypothetical protein n=1 Tax=Rhodococcus sp. NPDC059234 TaxID=3346781 RepID=UPI003671DD59
MRGEGVFGDVVEHAAPVSQSVPHRHARVVPRTNGDGLRGFVWPRTKCGDEFEAADYAARVGAALRG